MSSLRIGSVLPLLDEPDPSSQSNPHQIFTHHLHLDLTVDFTRHLLIGTAFHSLVVTDRHARELLMDSVGLTIKAVRHFASHQCYKRSIARYEVNLPSGEGTDLTFVVEPVHPQASWKGSLLRILLPLSTVSHCADSQQPLLIGIEYETSADSVGLQWLEPAQTNGQRYPYLYSQHEPIHARSTVPCQDTPSRKFTYTARLHVPRPMIALMSAPHLTGEPVAENEGHRTFEFAQHIPIPSYLLAIVVAVIERREISHRCAVWSEKETVEAGQFEFSDTELFLATAEKIAGPYNWSTYDLLLLPGVFPYGGMENPCLTFVTPTLLAGDRSLATVVAHEISHSWSGNLVTSHAWSHFYLNEGFTVFLERKILKALKGDAAYGLDAEIGWRSLEDAVKRFGKDRESFTILNVPLDDKTDPDDAFSTVPYEKGFNLLTALQNIVGERAMDEYLKAYFAHFAYSTCNTEGFKNFFLHHFASSDKNEQLQNFDWNLWLHTPGLPPKNPFDRSLLIASEQLASQWLNSSPPKDKLDILKEWECDQVVIFLQELHKAQLQLGNPTSLARLLEDIDKSYRLSSSKNSEITFEWLQLVINSQMTSFYPSVASFLSIQGRMKFTRPLYRELFTHGGDHGKQLAIETFTKHRSFYHPICAKMVAKDMGL